ncbi:MAG TPA: SRPBCC domain-containing protein [Streptosporangiaceae bacterium]
MTTVSAATWIDAPPATVWAVLTGLSRYPDWNPLFLAAAGDLAVGQRITLRRAPGGGFPALIRPRVTALTPDSELSWERRLPGLICGVHRFTLKNGNGGTLVLQSLTFHGIMARFSGRALDRAEANLEALSAALKAHCEAHRVHDDTT